MFQFIHCPTIQRTNNYTLNYHLIINCFFTFIFMGYDSVLLNTKIPQQHTYDAIVIGTGITGGYAAMELCKAGLRVLAVERGRNVVHGKYPTENKAPWQLLHRGMLTQKQVAEHPIQTRHFSYNEATAHFFGDDLKDAYHEKQRYDWIRPDVVGGRSLLWGRASYRWSDFDFEANLRDGYGTDWPFRYADLKPWYDKVERFVGISGNHDGIPHIPDGEFLPPFEFNCADAFLKTRIERSFPGRKVIMARVANLTRNHEGRVKCQARNQCERGCTFGAYFSSNSSTLPVAAQTGNLTLLADAHVFNILFDEETQVAKGVEVIDRKSLKTYTFYSKIIFLNGGTIASTALLLQSRSNRFPNGMGNDSDQLGRNLMDHHKGVWGSATIPGFEDKTDYGRRPCGIFIPPFRNVEKNDRPFLRSYIVPAYTGRGRKWSHAGIGENLKQTNTGLGPWTVNMGAYGECLPYPDNRMTLSTTQKDALGLPVVSFDCRFRENEFAMHNDMAATIEEMLTKSGCENIAMTVEMSYPGNANHEMGTARMGRDPKTSVLNEWNQVHAVPNVFVTDGSCMPSCGSANPSLTYLAITARAVDYAIKNNQIKT